MLNETQTPLDLDLMKDEVATLLDQIQTWDSDAFEHFVNMELADLTADGKHGGVKDFLGVEFRYWSLCADGIVNAVKLAGRWVPWTTEGGFASDPLAAFSEALSSILVLDCVPDTFLGPIAGLEQATDSDWSEIFDWVEWESDPCATMMLCSLPVHLSRHLVSYEDDPNNDGEFVCMSVDFGLGQVLIAEVVCEEPAYIRPYFETRVVALAHEYANLL